MSHSVFRDLDVDETSGNGSRAEVADNNLIVFIHKDGNAQVDPNGLQDLIVNANNTDTKSTVSVIRVGSPTPSMEMDEEGSSTKQSDGDDSESDSNKNSDDDGNDSKNSDESNEERDEDGASTEKSQKLKKKKKKKNKVPGYGLTVEDFYNPEQAIQFATEIMNIAGITNPRQLKADYEHLRHIILNDHCYTMYTYSDWLNEQKNKSEQDAPEGTKRNDTKSKQKSSATPAPSSTTKKVGRPSSKSTPSNGLNRDASTNSARNRSVDDASSNENTADQNESDGEEAESETDLSDFTASDTDNDRDSDLDFSVNDAHSRRSAKKIKKRKLQAKKLASKKRRRSTVDFTGSDDGATPKGKKAAKLPKKTPNSSAKSTPGASPVVSSTSKLSPAVTSTPRLTKVTYIKESPQTTSHDNSSKTPSIQKATSTTTTTTPQANPSPSPSSSSIDNKTKNINVVKQKEKKVQSENTVSDMTSLFTPDVIRKNPIENAGSVNKNPIIVVSANKNPLSKPTVRIGSVSKPIIVHSLPPHATTSRISTGSTPKVIRMPAGILRRVVKQPVAVTNLAAEQDKQLDLINSLVQEELSKSVPDASASSHTVVPAAIPNIVKMLETSEASPLVESADLAQPTSTSNTIPLTYSTTQPTHDTQVLPDELLESIVNSDYLTDDLMQHVAKLVEDKNLQEVIDQQMQDTNSIPSCTTATPQPSHVQTMTAVPKQNVVHSIASTPTKLREEQKVAANVAKTPTTPTNLSVLPAIANKKGITVRRADGSLVTLLPPEAPTTRGAKRRAESIPGQETPQKTENAKSTTEETDSALSEQKSMPNTPTTTESAKNSPSTAKQAAKPITARERRASVAIKRASTDSKPRRSMSISNPPPADVGIDDDEDDEEDGSDGSYNSEDDPHRLWCICRTPRNNRFMICCDKCEEWFHGKCVGITRQMGRDMEQSKTDWICPTCLKKQQPLIKNFFPRKVVVENSLKTKAAGSSSTIVSQSTTDSPVANCIVCRVKPSRPESIYCSDDCIRNHAKKTGAVSSSASESEPSSSAPSTPSTSFTLKSPTESEKKPQNSSSKKDSERCHDKKDRHESRSSSGSSSKHKRKRSRERHSSHSAHSHSHKDKSHDKDRKERSSGSDSRKDKKDHKSSGSSSSSSSNRSKHHSEKDRKRESTGKPIPTAPKIAKTDENSIIDKILKAQSTIDSILHPEEFKKSSEPTTVASVSSALTITSEGCSSSSTTTATALTRQPSAANESDQEPTSTVTIPSPPEMTQSTTPPPVERTLAPIVWSGAISMVDVATFQVSLSPLSGSTAMIDFPKEFDVVGRINPDTVWEYLDKIRISKDIVLLKFSPRSSSDDDETAYSTFINYLDTRKRLGVIKIPSKMVKDFYIMPLTSHKSLPSIPKTTTGFDLGADRPDLLLGIIVRNRMPQTSHLLIPPKHRQPSSIPFIGHKPVATIPAKDTHYTPPSSPNMNTQVQAISKQVIKSTFSTNLDDDDDEPYSPGGSDEDDSTLNTIPTSYLSSTSVNPIPDYAKPISGGSGSLSSFDKQQLEELNRQIEAEKKEIAMHLQTDDIDEPYSPTSSVSPPIGGANISDVVSNISIPANLADILKNVASFGSAAPPQLAMNQYGVDLIDTSDTGEYVPVASNIPSICYAPAVAAPPPPSQPSKLAQLTDEELLRLVPDEI